MKRLVLCALLGAACADDVVARARTPCGDGGCGVPGSCRATSCEDLAGSLCDVPTPVIAAAEACDALGAQGVVDALCSCSDAVFGGETQVLAEAGAAPVSVSVAGRVSTGATLDVAGELAAVGGVDAPERVRAERLTSSPGACDCSSAARLDLAALSPRYDDVIAADALAGFSDDTTLSVGCGAHRLTRIAGAGELTLRVSGHALVVVDGNVELDRSFSIELADGARLELVVRGSVRVGGALSWGGPEGALVAYVGGTGTIDVRGAFALGGRLYAPDAELVLAGAAEVHGALFVRRLAAQSTLTLYAAGLGTLSPSCPSTRAAASSPLFTASGMPTPR